MSADRPRGGKPGDKPRSHDPRKAPGGGKRPKLAPKPPIPPGPKAKKTLGQHFLADERAARAIAEAVEATPDATVLEIGPGTGALTRPLLETPAGALVALELDPRMEPGLRTLSAIDPRLRVVMGDVLEVPWSDLGLPEDPAHVRIVGNLPYYVTSPILQRLIQADRLEREPFAAVRPLASRIVLMVQKEVAERLEARPGTKAYGSLSVLVQYAGRVERVVDVPRGAFRPVPAVDSAVVALIPHATPPVALEDPARTFRLVRASFAQRRKTLGNALAAAGYAKEAVAAAAHPIGLDLGRRGETLSLAEFAALSDGLARAAGSAPA